MKPIEASTYFITNNETNVTESALGSAEEEVRIGFVMGVPDYPQGENGVVFDYSRAYIAVVCFCILLIAIPCGLLAYKKGMRRKTRRMGRRLTLLNATLNIDPTHGGLSTARHTVVNLNSSFYKNDMFHDDRVSVRSMSLPAML
ncbi:uncharacterized protein LOC144422729 [Styela clava]